MRFDTPVDFVKEQTKYDYNTGNHDALGITKTRRLANVTNQSEERMAIAYGDIEQQRLTVRLQNHYVRPFDYLLIDGAKYRVDSERKLRRHHILQVSGL